MNPVIIYYGAIIAISGITGTTELSESITW